MTCPRCSMASREVWADLAALIRQITQRRLGIHSPPVSITIHLMGGDRVTYPLPQPEEEDEGSQRPRERESGWASGPEPKHLTEFRQVYWPGLGVFTLSRMQALVVAELWEARFDRDHPDVSQDVLLRAAGSSDTKLCGVFKRSPAWGKLILKGDTSATYRLPDLPDGHEDSE